MEKQIKKTFWLLGGTLIFFDIIVYIGSISPGYAQANVNELVIFFFLVLSFVLFIFSYITNVVKYYKEVKSRKYLIVLTSAIFFMGLFFVPSYFKFHVEKSYELFYVTLFQFSFLIASIIIYTKKN